MYFTLRRLAEFIHQMQHCIAWQRIVPFLGLLHQLAFAERTG